MIRDQKNSAFGPLWPNLIVNFMITIKINLFASSQWVVPIIIRHPRLSIKLKQCCLPLVRVTQKIDLGLLHDQLNRLHHKRRKRIILVWQKVSPCIAQDTLHCLHFWDFDQESHIFWKPWYFPLVLVTRHIFSTIFYLHVVLVCIFMFCCCQVFWKH